MAACRSDQPQQTVNTPAVSQEEPTFSLIDTSGMQIFSRFRTPSGYDRILAEKGSFGEHLRTTLLRPHDAQVYYYNGKVKYQRNVYDAVLAWDITSNAMTGIDCLTWFHSEYCFKTGRHDLIAYPLHSGFLMDFNRWKLGERVFMEDNQFRWEKTADPDDSYFQLRNFQEYVFAYADVKSAKYQTEAISPSEIRFGSVFISEDRWGHGVIVVDVADNPATGDRVFLLAQSFVPGQEMQILQNPIRDELSPWYSVSDLDSILVTPEWTFTRNEVFQFKGL